MDFLVSDFNVAIWLLLVLGFSAGLMSGFYGIGGGWLVTPILNLAGLPMPYAVGTSLIYVIVNSIVGTLKHRKSGNVVYTLGLFIGISSILGVLLGKKFVFYLENLNLADSVIRYIYVVFLMLESLYMLIEKKLRFTPKDSRVKKIIPPIININLNGKNDLKISVWKIIFIGAFVGFLSSTLGVGGGFILLPILIYIVKVPTKLAVGTSIFTTFITSFSGGVGYVMAKHVDWRSVLFMIITTFLGIIIGANATEKVKSDNLKFLFAIMVFVAAVSVLFKQLGYGGISIALITGIAGVSSIIIIYISYVKKAL